MKGLFFLSLLVVFIPISCKQMPVLTGTWKLIADQEIDSLQTVVRQDTDVSGLLIYTASGKMSVQLLWNQVRNPILNDSIMIFDGNSGSLGLGSNSWTPEQNRILIDSYESYFGTYDVNWDEHQVIHRVHGNLRPEKKQTAFKRIFKIDKDTLYLRSADSRQKWQVKWVREN